MKNKKAIKKPSFIRKFLVWLALLWIITAILFSTLYFVSNNMLLSSYETEYEYNKAIEDLKEKGNTFSEVHTKFATEKQILNLDTGIYRLPYEYQSNQALADLYLAIYEYARNYDVNVTFKRSENGNKNMLPLYWDDVASILSYSRGGPLDPGFDSLLRPAYPITKLTFKDKDGNNVKLPLANEYSASEKIHESYADKLNEVNGEFFLPLWNLYFVKEYNDPYSGSGVETIKLKEVYVSVEKGAFIPKELDYKGNTYSLYTDKCPVDLRNYSSYTSFQLNQCDMMIFKRPEGMENSANIEYISAGNLDEGYSLTFSVTPMTTKDLIEVLPEVVIGNAVIWFAAAGIVAGIIAYINYLRSLSTYRIFEYRKQLTDSMAHDLKTPLAAVSAYAENLEEDVNPEKHAYYSSTIRENVESMNKSIEKILDFSKSETGKRKLSKSNIDIRKLIEDEISATKELFEKRDITIVLEGECVIRSDKELLEQALNNLIGNAAKYARPESTYNIVIDKKTLTMSNLTDQKIKDVNELKKPFVKGEKSRGSMTGNGLGLAIADNCLASAGHKLDLSFEDETFKTTITW